VDRDCGYAPRRVEELTKQNAELRELIATLVRRSDEVFASRAWKLGRIAARIERPFRKLLLRDRSPYRHLKPAYFHDPVRDCPIPPPPVTGRYDDVPPTYVHCDVRTAFADLWDAAGRENSALC
jgi:hypothetical protein